VGNGVPRVGGGRGGDGLELGEGDGGAFGGHEQGHGGVPYNNTTHTAGVPADARKAGITAQSKAQFCEGVFGLFEIAAEAVDVVF
jgi:hypothetical protein